MAGHHSPSAASALREKDTLVGCLVGSGPGGGAHAGTFDAVRDFLIQFRDQGIPWVRIYESTPAWQQQSGGLLIQDWDGDAAAEGAKVFFTLITTRRGGAINRRALGGGTWTSKTAPRVGDEVAVSTLYFKRGGSSGRLFTAWEIHLRNEPQVAICLLHPTNYLYSIRDLRLYIGQGWFPGGTQANLGAEQYQDPDVSGFVSGSRADYTTILFSSSETIYDQQSIHSTGAALPPHDASLDAISHHLFSENNSTPEFGGQYSHADEISILNEYYNTLMGTNSNSG
ncbi:uncharacterized protein [Aegilops tauschii subsp. strangulata]|uniref:uncharacterized protein n=1 Tax=Aegilops tauschii subsp. strangulata TaxID=200361 RepID=UPI001ABC2C13|nr:uncharacterized protein LOC109774356 [Aegilops tauschii subsp. strangulata]